jgi:hypothetical protein
MSSSVASAANTVHNDAYLTKSVFKLLGRIERIVIPTNSIVKSSISFTSLMKLVETGIYFEKSSCSNFIEKRNECSKSDAINNGQKIPIPTFIPKIIKWNELEIAIVEILAEGNKDYIVPVKVFDEIYPEKSFQYEEENRRMTKEKVLLLKV